MRLNWKIVWLAMWSGVVLLAAGCSGINASKSVSPATFLMPGLMQADPPPSHPDGISPTADPSTEAVQS